MVPFVNPLRALDVSVSVESFTTIEAKRLSVAS